jgi:hypothetical protein
MKYAVYTREGLDYGTPYGVYSTMGKAQEVKTWLESLGNICYIYKGEMI